MAEFLAQIAPNYADLTLQEKLATLAAFTKNYTGGGADSVFTFAMRQRGHVTRLIQQRAEAAEAAEE